MAGRITGLGWPRQEPVREPDAVTGLGWPRWPVGPAGTVGPVPEQRPAAPAAAAAAAAPAVVQGPTSPTSDPVAAAPVALPLSGPPVEAPVDAVVDAVVEAVELPVGADQPPARAAATAQQVLGRALRGSLEPPQRTRVLAVANQKGGVGKTTTVVNIAAALALHGLTVLVLDVDPQGNASTALSIDHHAEVPSVYDVLIEGRPLREVVQQVDGLRGLLCAPATIDLAGAEIELVSVVARESRLQRALTTYARERTDRGEPRIDYVLIDCPPSLGLLTVNALVAAEEVLVPVQCEYYALEGLGQLWRNIDLIRQHLNPDLHVSTMLLTMYDGRTRLAAQVADEVRDHFPALVLKTTVPRSVRVSEAPSYGQTVMTYDPSSSGALSYLEVARELAGRPADAGAPSSAV